MGANWSFGLCLQNAFNVEHIVQALDLSDWIGKVQKYYGKPRRLRARLSWMSGPGCWSKRSTPTRTSE